MTNQEVFHRKQLQARTHARIQLRTLNSAEVQDVLHQSKHALECCPAIHISSKGLELLKKKGTHPTVVQHATEREREREREREKGRGERRTVSD